MLYMDDGNSLNYQSGEKVLVAYFFDKMTLSVSKVKDSSFDGALAIKFTRVDIYLY